MCSHIHVQTYRDDNHDEENVKVPKYLIARKQEHRQHFYCPKKQNRKLII